MKRFAIFGATSAIARETAREAVRRGDHLFLVARSPEKLKAVADDLRARGGTVHERVADLDDTGAHAAILDEAERALGGLDTVLVAHGVLTDQAKAEQAFAEVEAGLRTNFLSAASICTHAANRFEARRAGTICVIGSVAGDRGRPKNYAYGSAKAALDSFLSGLRARLYPAGVAVVTVKPGFVDTPMTAHIQKKGPLFASAETVGKDIYRAIEKRRMVVYTPWFWWGIMTIVRAIPEFVFRRLKL